MYFLDIKLKYDAKTQTIRYSFERIAPNAINNHKTE